MTRISNPFRYTFKTSYPSEPSIYKMWFGKKYLIWKCKALHQSVNSVAKELDQRLRLGLKVGDPFTKVVEHIRRARVTIFEVEAIVQSDNPVDLLITEHRLLKDSVADPSCLNTSFFPGFPKWIPETAVSEFQTILAKAKAAAKKKKQARITKKKGATSKRRKKAK